MRVESFHYRGWRGAGFNLSFTPGVNALVGINGCGKTNTMELLAILVGHKDATKLIRQSDKLEYAKVVLSDDVERYTLEVDGLDFDKIAAFKDTLPTLASFVLQQESLRDDRFVTERREPVECQRTMLDWLKSHRLDLNLHVKTDGASLLVSETGAQRYLLIAGMRRAPTHTPMLVEHPERNLHVILRRRLPTFYRQSKEQQLILTTHCPEVMSSISRDPYVSSDALDCAIDMCSKAIQW